MLFEHFTLLSTQKAFVFYFYIVEILLLSTLCYYMAKENIVRFIITNCRSIRACQFALQLINLLSSTAGRKPPLIYDSYVCRN